MVYRYVVVHARRNLDRYGVVLNCTPLHTRYCAGLDLPPLSTYFITDTPWRGCMSWHIL